MEAALNVACAGGEPLALTDCLNFGNPERPEIGWELARAIEGIAAAANALGIPVVSGNVSLYNETGGRPIPPTPVVGCVGLVADVRRIPSRWRRGDRLVLLRGEGAALVRFVWQNAARFTLAHDIGHRDGALALREAAAWSGVETTSRRPGRPRRARGARPRRRDTARVGRPPRAGDGLMCGVFGIRAPGRDVARLAYFGLFALQHRGQESAGIAVSDDGRLTGLRDLGLVTQVFDEQNLSGLRGELAIGHTRYSTTGSNAWANAQPVLHHGARADGRARAQRQPDQRRRAPPRARGPTRVELGQRGDRGDDLAAPRAPLEEAIAGAMARLEGAATVVGLADGQLFGFRDRHGFRPLVLGYLGDDPVLASETCALDLVGAEFEREIRPGELVVVGDDGLRSQQVLTEAERGSLCIFEYFYLARPDTRLEGVEVHGARVRMGVQLAAESPAEADLVLPIPDSGTPAAIGFSRATGIPFSEGLIKNRYVHRTFIQPEQGMRDQGIRMKFNPLAEVAGKRLVIVDDSIVRGSTTRQIVQMLFDAGRGGGARAHLLTADRVTVLLRDRPGERGRDDRRATTRSTRCGTRSAPRRSPTSRSRASRRRPRGRRRRSAAPASRGDYPTRVPQQADEAALRARRCGTLTRAPLRRSCPRRARRRGTSACRSRSASSCPRPRRPAACRRRASATPT